MDERLNAVPRTIGSLLQVSLRVPAYQRDYSWGLQEHTDFWEDLTGFADDNAAHEEIAENYFLGAIVTVHGGAELEILDGQQRIVTSAILLAALRDAAGKVQEGHDDAASWQQQYLAPMSSRRKQIAIRLHLNSNDDAFFRERILARNPSSSQSLTLQSWKNIDAAKRFFDTKLDHLAKRFNDGSEFLDYCRLLAEVLLDHVYVINIASAKEEISAQAFEVLNDRGLNLSTPDLLRSLLLRRAKARDIPEVRDLWSDILKLGSDQLIRQFLRHFWISQFGDLKAHALYRVMKKAIVEQKIDSLLYSTELHQNYVLYDDILSGRSEVPDLGELYEELRQINAFVVYPVLLAAARHWKKAPRKMTHCAQALLSAYVRYVIVGKLNTSEFEDEIYGIAKRLHDNAAFDYSGALLRLVPSDREFISDFAVASIASPTFSKYLLRKIEISSRRTDETRLASPRQLWLEHVYPQHPAERWSTHDEMVDRLGNLTLLGKNDNRRLQNSKFEKKRTAYGSSEIKMTRALSRLRDWSERSIDKRQKEMAKAAPRLWPM